MENFTQKLSNYIRQQSDVNVTEIALYSIFLKYCELDKNEWTIKIQDFFHVFSSHENFNEFQIEKRDAEISVKKFIEANVWFFDNEGFREWFFDMFTVTIFEKDYYPVFLYIAKIIDNVTNRQELIETFEPFLSQFWRDSIYEGIIGNTNINKIISGVLDIKTGTIYDPAFGSGQLLIEIQKHTNQKINFFWKEINALAYGLAKINLYIHWISSTKLERGDAFASIIGENGWKFDYVVCDPPFWIKDFENPWLQHVNMSLNKTGKGAILLPLSSTFKKTGRWYRAELVSSSVIDSIILLPKWSLKPYTSIDTVLWIFDKQKENKDIFFIDWRKLSVDEIIAIQTSQSEIEGKSKRVIHENIIKYDYNFNPWIQVNWIEKEIESYSEDKRNIGRWLKKFTDIQVPQEYLEGLSEELQLLLKKGKTEGKITYDELLAAMPHAEDDVDKLDDVYTRFMKLNVEIVDSFPEEIAEEKHEYEQGLPKLQKNISNSENKQKANNLDNITNFNDEIHKKILQISNVLENVRWYTFYPRFFYKKIFADWNENTKNSMRLSNIISLNNYIYNKDTPEKIENQRKLVEYFDKHLEKEWLLKTKWSYANNLFWFLVIESIALLGLIIWAGYTEKKDFIELVKIFTSVWLAQIALMVRTIVVYLFPKNGDTEKNEKNTTWNPL